MARSNARITLIDPPAWALTARCRLTNRAAACDLSTLNMSRQTTHADGLVAVKFFRVDHSRQCQHRRADEPIQDNLVAPKLFATASIALKVDGALPSPKEHALVAAISELRCFRTGS